MKKLILLFTVITIGLTACSKDDDSSTQDPFIGTWTLYQVVNNGVELTLSDCDKQYSVQVNSDGTLIEAYYDDFNGTCELDEEIPALWKNLGKNLYSLTYDAGTEDEYIFEQTIIFKGNTFTIEESNGSVVYIKN
jgi:hypothetical protein